MLVDRIALLSWDGILMFLEGLHRKYALISIQSYIIHSFINYSNIVTYHKPERMVWLAASVSTPAVTVLS